jgi:GWxTD domain-containing protein
MLSDPLTQLQEGRRRGGPLCLLLVLLVACATARPGAAAPEALDRITNPLDLYREHGLLAGSPAFPAVASFAAFAGPGDSTLILLGMSLPASALRFQREGGGFAASYRVTLALTSADSSARLERTWTEHVRVAAFAETTRDDESIIFQRALTVSPGRYLVQLDAADANSARGFRAADTLDARAFIRDERAVSAPVLVHVAQGRTTENEPPELILNPRHTVAYGAQPPRIYLEAYGGHDSSAVMLRVRDASDSVVWQAAIPMPDTTRVRFALVEVPPDQLPLGQLSLEADDGRSATQRVPLLVTVSDQWVVANFDEVLQFIAYIATTAEMDSLRAGTAAERRSQWDAFWQRRDPYPATSRNEFREEFFARIRAATLQFSEPGARAGWQTARGEVYIVLGPPDQVLERYTARTDIAVQPNALEWIYSSLPGGRVSLLFVDRTGFGRLELEPASRAAFRRAAERLMQRR